MHANDCKTRLIPAAERDVLAQRTRRANAPRELGTRRRLCALFLFLLQAACSDTAPAQSDAPQLDRAQSDALQRFTIAVIPDTQNYIDYKLQTAEGFAFDASALFLAQMRDIAARDDVVFVAAVGDVWEHPTLPVDPEHVERGVGAIPNPLFARKHSPTEKTSSVEIPKAIEGYRILAAGGKPFGVAPGNHDYDATWSVEGFPPNLREDPASLDMVPEELGMLHIGGLDNFRSAFGADSEFFEGKPWYVASFRGGANSAQVFRAGGYDFLHITLEMGADNEALGWVEHVLAQHPGKPVILTTHDYLDPFGQRRAFPIVDLARVDPDHHNSPEDIWSKLVSRNDQVFMVLSGHHRGQSRRIDRNQSGHEVIQLLADYQGRGQVGLEAGVEPDGPRGPTGIGDGWYRLLEFDFSQEIPRLKVRTWSSHYLTDSRQAELYAQWYKRHEHPDWTDQEFLDADDFDLDLADFRQRFGSGPSK